MKIKYCKAKKQATLSRPFPGGENITVHVEIGDIFNYYIDDYNRCVMRKGNPYEPYPYAVPNHIYLSKDIVDYYFDEISDPGFRRDFPPINTNGTSGTSGLAGESPDLILSL